MCHHKGCGRAGACVTCNQVSTCVAASCAKAVCVARPAAVVRCTVCRGAFPKVFFLEGMHYNAYIAVPRPPPAAAALKGCRSQAVCLDFLLYNYNRTCFVGHVMWAMMYVNAATHAAAAQGKYNSQCPFAREAHNQAGSVHAGRPYCLSKSNCTCVFELAVYRVSVRRMHNTSTYLTMRWQEQHRHQWCSTATKHRGEACFQTDNYEACMCS